MDKESYKCVARYIYDNNSFYGGNVHALLCNVGLMFRKNKTAKDFISLREKISTEYVKLKTKERVIDAMAQYLERYVLKERIVYIPGDKVLVVQERPEDTLFVSDMEQYLGKVVTIGSVQARCYTIRQDNGRFAWIDDFFVKKVGRA